MTDGSGPISGEPLAWLDPDGSCWRMSQGTLLSEAPELLPSLPRWGTTHGGALFERPTPALPTDVSGGSVLPTPTARDWKDGSAHTANVPENSLLGRVVWRFLPTPTASDTRGSRSSTARRRPDSTGNIETTLTDAAWIMTGLATSDPMSRLSDGGKPSSDDPPPNPSTDGPSTPDSSSG